MRRIVAGLVVALALLTPPARSAARAPSATDLLDQYARGDFAAVTATFDHLDDFQALLADLQATAPGWMAAAPPDSQGRRRLVAATVALEAARADERREWKLVLHHDPVGGFQPADAVYWKPPPRLIAWAAGLFSAAGPPTASEHLWQLAAIAVAERGEDFEFLLGSPWEARGKGADEEFTYLPPVVKRFPAEPRFQLAQAIAFEWRSWPAARRSTEGTKEAIDSLSALMKDETVGGEAMVRLGELRLRQGSLDEARAILAKVETATRDPYLVYLGRFLTGQALERDHRVEDAITAYRRALLVIPGAQSASVALSAELFLRDGRTEAATVLTDSLSRNPHPVDPWRTFADGDDRFWPELIGRLRREIAR